MTSQDLYDFAFKERKVGEIFKVSKEDFSEINKHCLGHDKNYDAKSCLVYGNMVLMEGDNRNWKQVINEDFKGGIKRSFKN